MTRLSGRPMCCERLRQEHNESALNSSPVAARNSLLTGGVSPAGLAIGLAGVTPRQRRESTVACRILALTADAASSLILLTLRCRTTRHRRPPLVLGPLNDLCAEFPARSGFPGNITDGAIRTPSRACTSRRRSHAVGGERAGDAAGLSRRHTVAWYLSRYPPCKPAAQALPGRRSAKAAPAHQLAPDLGARF